MTYGMVFLCCYTFLVCAAKAAGVPEGVELEVSTPEDVTDEDLSDILSIAARLGLTKPVRLSVRPDSLFRPCLAATVSEAGRVFRGNRVETRSVRVVRSDRPSCGRAGAGHLRAGRWRSVQAKPRVDVAWRIVDGDWHVDVGLGEGMGYDVASRLILAIRHRTLVVPEDARPHLDRLWAIDPREIHGAMLGTDWIPPLAEESPDDGTWYALSAPGNQLVFVQADEQRVLFRAVGEWVE